MARRCLYLNRKNIKRLILVSLLTLPFILIGCIRVPQETADEIALRGKLPENCAVGGGYEFDSNRFCCSMPFRTSNGIECCSRGDLRNINGLKSDPKIIENIGKIGYVYLGDDLAFSLFDEHFGTLGLENRGFRTDNSNEYIFSYIPKDSNETITFIEKLYFCKSECRIIVGDKVDEVVNSGRCEISEPTIECEESDAEPNNEFRTANVRHISSCNTAVGNVQKNDWDIYEIGNGEIEDSISISKNVYVEHITMALFNENEELLRMFMITSSIRNVQHNVQINTPKLYTGIMTPRDYENYDFLFRKEENMDISSKEKQTVLLDFDGAENTRIHNRPYFVLTPFNADDLGEMYVGRTQQMIDIIKTKIREDYSEYNVDIFSSDESIPDGEYTVVYFTNIRDNFLLGISDNIDQYNSIKSDRAVVYAGNFIRYNIMNLNINEMATMIANVGSHELGHTLGLYHTINPKDIMDTTSSAWDLKADQQLLTSNLEESVFVRGKQNPHLLLELGVGKK